MMCPQGATEDGFETQMGVNCIGHFLLARMLLPPLKAAGGRQIWLSSSGHSGFGGNPVDLDYYRNFNAETSSYDPMVQYQQSKLGDILLAKEFSRRHEVEAVSVHPGVIRTNLSRHLSIWTLVSLVVKMFMGGRSQPFKTPEQGEATSVYCATLPSETLVVGEYYADCDVAECSSPAKDMEAAAKFYDYCEECTQKFQ